MAKKRNFLKISDFCEKWEVTENTVFVMKSHNDIDTNVIREIDKYLRIDENHYIKRLEFRKKIDNIAHDYYYFLRKVFCDSEISELMMIENPDTKITQWNTFFNSALFAQRNDTIFNNTIGSKKWQFYRTAKRIIQRLFNLIGITMSGKDLLKIYDVDVSMPYSKKREMKIMQRLPNRDRYEQIYKERGCTR